MTASTADVARGRAFEAPLALVHGLQAFAIAGAALFALGLFVEPVRAWSGFLMGFSLLVAVGLSGPLFTAFLVLSGARWATPLLRVPSAMGAVLPAAAALGALLVFGTSLLYEWSHPAVVELDPLLAAKAPWLSTPGFALRTLAVLLAWNLLARRLASRCDAYVATGDGRAREGRLRSAAALVAVVAVSYSIASVDWLMSLEPHWFSTLFPLLSFSALMATGLAGAVLLVLLAERQGALRGTLRDEHLHDLGKLLFALTLIWAYLWYCQYMLIWYTDIPEETAHYALRRQGGWWMLTQTSLLLGFAVPFVALLGRRACRSRKVLGRVAAVVLVGQAVALLVQVGPPISGKSLVFGIWEAGPLVGGACLAFLIALKAMTGGPFVRGRTRDLHAAATYSTP